MEHILPKLPYGKNELEPYISSKTFDYHYEKHHKTYVDKLNWLIKWTKYENMSLEDIIKESKFWVIYNNSAQVFNHTFYFNWLTPNYKNPSDKLLKMICDSFWDFLKFKEDFTNMALNNFWSGWTWLVLNQNWKLEIINTSNAWNLLDDDSKKALLTCDVWEHAYYIDVFNDRKKYLENFWNVVNFDFVEKNLK